MNMSFDLDGVIANTDKWFFRMLNVMYQVSPGNDELLQMELDYYASRPLNYNPHLFMNRQDTGIIITARKPWSKTATERWLLRYGITLPVIHVDYANVIDWGVLSYEEASYIAGEMKAGVISLKGVSVHFDNNPYVVRKIRELLPCMVVILVGNEDRE